MENHKVKTILAALALAALALTAAVAGSFLLPPPSRLNAAISDIAETEHFYYRGAPEGPYIDSQRGDLLRSAAALERPSSDRRADHGENQRECTDTDCTGRIQGRGRCRGHRERRHPFHNAPISCHRDINRNPKIEL